MFSRESWYMRLATGLLSEKTRSRCEHVIVMVAIGSFLLHLLLILLHDLQWLPAPVDSDSSLLNNPIAAIYTPFSFILLYEVYLLIYHIPQSTTIYIGKQYEIITLIIIRRIFKDLSKLEFTPNWFEVREDLQFTYDLMATILLFLLIFTFYRLSERLRSRQQVPDMGLSGLAGFLRTKKIVAVALVPIFIGLGIYSLGSWAYETFLPVPPPPTLPPGESPPEVRDINRIFFDEFFTVLIMTDVLLLLISFLHIEKFNRVIRDSGFIISTILIKLSFGAEGLTSTVLVVVAVAFGVAILAIHLLYERIRLPTDRTNSEEPIPAPK